MTQTFTFFLEQQTWNTTDWKVKVTLCAYPQTGRWKLKYARALLLIPSVYRRCFRGNRQSQRFGFYGNLDCTGIYISQEFRCKLTLPRSGIVRRRVKAWKIAISGENGSASLISSIHWIFNSRFRSMPKTTFNCGTHLGKAFRREFFSSAVLFQCLSSPNPMQIDESLFGQRNMDEIKRPDIFFHVNPSLGVCCPSFIETIGHLFVFTFFLFFSLTLNTIHFSPSII